MLTNIENPNPQQMPAETIEKSNAQIQRLNWIKTELIRLQEVYEEVLTLSPILKRLILDVNELTDHLLKLIRFTVLLAEQVKAYYQRSEEFSLERITDLLNRVEEARQVIINHISYLIDYYNRLASLAGIISDSENTLIPKDAYKYTNALKRYVDLELENSKRELLALSRISPEILMILEDITRDSKHAHRRLYLDIQRVVARVVKCYIALGGQASVTAEKTVFHSNEIVTRENAVDPYQRLCQNRKGELDQLVSKMEWAYHILNRFLLPHARDYVPREAGRFERFFENNAKLLNDFTGFVSQVVKKTEHVNPNRGQKEIVSRRELEKGKWVTREEIRDREIMLIIIDELPVNMPVTYEGRTIQVPRGSEFVIKFGSAYFDRNPSAKPVGYVQVFLPHEVLDAFNIPDANELYVGKKVYVSLNETQTNLWQEVILLSLIAVGIKYDVLPPRYLQRYLINKLQSQQIGLNAPSDAL